MQSCPGGALSCDYLDFKSAIDQERTTVMLIPFLFSRQNDFCREEGGRNVAVSYIITYLRNFPCMDQLWAGRQHPAGYCGSALGRRFGHFPT